MDGEKREPSELKPSQLSIETAPVFGREKDAKHEMKAVLHLIKAEDPENDYGADYIKVDLFGRWPDSTGHEEWKEEGVGKFFNGGIQGCEADLGTETWSALGKEMEKSIRSADQDWIRASGLDNPMPNVKW